MVFLGKGHVETDGNDCADEEKSEHEVFESTKKESAEGCSLGRLSPVGPVDLFSVFEVFVGDSSVCGRVQLISQCRYSYRLKDVLKSVFERCMLYHLFFQSRSDPHCTSLFCMYLPTPPVPPDLIFLVKIPKKVILILNF